MKSFFTAFVCSALLWSGHAMADEMVNDAPMEIIISVPDQKLVLKQDGAVLKKFPISTSRFGVGDSLGSYKTPVGRLRVCEKMGDGLPMGAVFKKRNPTGEVLRANAPGRDPIVTRILWLDGSDPSNCNARQRGIYIHGTPVEKQIGKPVSYGCIRMKSQDVVDLYAVVPVGTSVVITTEKVEKPKGGIEQVMDFLLADNSSGSGSSSNPHKSGNAFTR